MPVKLKKTQNKNSLSVDKPRKNEFHKGLNDSPTEPKSAFKRTGIGPVPQTEEEQIARLNELLLLISNEEESVMSACAE